MLRESSIEVAQQAKMYNILGRCHLISKNLNWNRGRSRFVLGFQAYQNKFSFVRIYI